MTARVNAEIVADAGLLKEIFVQKSPLPFGFDGGEGVNTRIDYRLLDHTSNSSAKGSVVLAGRITKDDLFDLAESLESGVFFEPFRGGIPDLGEKMPRSWNGADTARHAIDRISFTNNSEAAYLPTADQFIAALSDGYQQYASAGTF